MDFQVFQMLGGTLALSAAQCAFDNRLISALASTAPGIDPSLVLATGATEIRSAFSADEVPGIVMAYIDGLRVVWAIAVSLGGCAFVVCFFGSWKRLIGGDKKSSSA
jgi:MFS transporter, DHA2 family, glioxin efflux transporter